jgi:hypothetical protein
MRGVPACKLANATRKEIYGKASVYERIWMIVFAYA